MGAQMVEAGGAEVEAADGVRLMVQGVEVMIARTSCHCGGEWAWMHRRPSGAWEMKGCICHNPAVGP